MKIFFFIAAVFFNFFVMEQVTRLSQKKAEIQSPKVPLEILAIQESAKIVTQEINNKIQQCDLSVSPFNDFGAASQALVDFQRLQDLGHEKGSEERKVGHKNYVSEKVNCLISEKAIQTLAQMMKDELNFDSYLKTIGIQDSRNRNDNFFTYKKVLKLRATDSFPKSAEFQAY
jgi:hypothetical protein